jgi:hypothetical protein
MKVYHNKKNTKVFDLDKCHTNCVHSYMTIPLTYHHKVTKQQNDLYKRQFETSDILRSYPPVLKAYKHRESINCYDVFDIADMRNNLRGQKYKKN